MKLVGSAVAGMHRIQEAGIPERPFFIVCVLAVLNPFQTNRLAA
ncbi:MAG: hypothetical protein Q8M09_18095 [Pseudomonadota bacterium]|nr:hypothetical protein [Pseudomonadota bacterium]MDP1572894.1 hypothetical protein [Pseudomonadota bacterium]MDP1906130.1 hypothetical protein [Pseudomonadota bacterium]